MAEDGERIGIVTALIRVAFLVNAAYAQSGREQGVTPQQGQLLSLLRPKPYGMGELRDKLGLAKSTVTGLVDVLERDGLVHREAGRPTARSVEVALTGPGRAVADRFHDAVRGRIEAVLAPLDPAGRETLQTLMGDLVRRDDVAMIFMDTGRG